MAALDIRQLYDDFGIDWSDHGAEITKGWVNTSCPFCGDTKMHLGYNPQLDMFSCWKCSIHNKFKTLSELLRVPSKEIQDIIKCYRDNDVEQIIRKKTNVRELILPDNYGKLMKSHCNYLRGRNYDPHKMQNQYGLVGTTKHGDFANRIIFPIYYKGRLVSFHSRDVTNKHTLKAMACPEDKEVIRHKELLWNFDNISKVAVLCEAPLDAMRFGYDIGIATFGIKFTTQQIELLRSIPYLFIAYDSGPGEVIAQKQAKRIADLVGVFNKVWIIDDLGKDPAELSDKEVRAVRNEIFKIVENESC